MLRGSQPARSAMQTTASDAVLEQVMRTGDAGARIELGNRLLSRHRYGTEEHQRGLELLLAAAEKGPLAAQAAWFLGAYYLQVAVQPGAAEHAAAWMQQAADAGMPGAVDRLADMYLSGRGVERSAARAFELQRQLADQGYSRAAWEAGYLMDRGGADSAVDGNHAAADFFARACALGDPAGYYSLGLRFAAGDGVPADPSFGRALLLRAVDAGFAGAAEAADALASAGTATGAPEWYRRLKENMDAAPLETLAPGRASPAQRRLATDALEAHFAGVAHPALGLDGNGRLQVRHARSGRSGAPGEWQWLSESPRVAVSEGFASREECDHLVNKMARSLRRAGEYRRGGRANDDAEVLHFSGTGHPVGPMGADSVVRVMEQRIAGMAGWSLRALEPASVIRYVPGEEYRSHVDYFSAGQIERDRSEGRDFGGQRVATFLVCLRAPRAGGATFYEKAGVEVTGRPGQGVLHYNVTADGAPDPTSLHSGRPVEEGEKWLWRSTLREHPLDLAR